MASTVSTDSVATSLPGVPGVAFSGTIEPTRLSPAYRAGLAVVAAAMVLLPLLYLLLVAGVAGAVWWHLTANSWLLEGRGSGQGRLFLYLAPAVVGVALVFFMVKPVLARRGKGADPVPIEPDEEPGLFAFVEEICRQVRAPLPRRVQVDCQVNASASFQRGVRGVFGRDLTLTIGLPLASGLSIRELGGVLAHEFGHFAQGGGMRLTLLVRSVNAWFARVVYERDHWDQKIAVWSKRGDWRLAIVLLAARGSIWLSRRALWALMMAGHAISCFMMRQMEYDADSYEIKLAGSEAFARTSTRLRELSAGAQAGYHDMQQAWQRRNLPSNLPVFLAARTSRLPDEVLVQLRAVPVTPTGLFDTHPSDADRVQAAMAAGAAGVLVGGDAPAAELFKDFEALGVRATQHHYTQDLGLDLRGATLVAVDHALDERERRVESLEAIGAFFGDRVSICRALRLPVSDLDGLDDTALRREMGAARDAMAAADTRLPDSYRRVEQMADRRDQAFAAEEILRAGVPIDGEAFELAESTLENAASTQAWALEQQRELATWLDGFEQAAVRRLACGVILASRHAVPEARALADALTRVAGVIPPVHEAGRVLRAASILAQLPSDGGLDVSGPIGTLSDRIRATLQRVRAELGDVPCPSVVCAEPTTLAAWCGFVPDADGSIGLDVVDRLPMAYWELLGRMVTIVREIEG